MCVCAIYNFMRVYAISYVCMQCRIYSMLDYAIARVCVQLHAYVCSSTVHLSHACVVVCALVCAHAATHLILRVPSLESDTW